MSVMQYMSSMNIYITCIAQKSTDRQTDRQMAFQLYTVDAHIYAGLGVQFIIGQGKS